MRALTILVAGLTVAGLVLAFTPTLDARPSVACTDLKGGGGVSCPGIVCVDEDLNGQYGYNECIEIYCLHGCCYGQPCPPPDWD